jgi:GNAT superfamily N-acetyltransferase
MKITIRPATPEDTAAIAAILNELDWFTPPNDALDETTLSRHLQLCTTGNNHTVLAAQTAAGEVVGYAAVHWLPYLFLPGPEGYVSELFVRRAARGQGAGAQLLAAVKAQAQARGCFRLRLLNHRQRESYQRSFYKKQGWQEHEWMAVFTLPLDLPD